MKRPIALAATTLATLMFSLPVAAQDAPKKKAPPAAAPKKSPPRRPAAKPAPPPPKDAEPVEEEAQAPEDAEAEEAAPEAEESEAPETPEDAISPEEEAPDEDVAEDEVDEPDEPDEVAVEPPKRERKRRRRPPARPARPSHPKYLPKQETPLELEYVEGMDIPDGYTKVEQTRTGLVIAGAITFGVGWLAAVTAAVAYTDGEHECFGGSNDFDYRGGGYDELGCGRGTQPDDFLPLYIPIAGPFIAMGTLDHADGGVRAGLLLDGVVQVGGAAMFVAGLVAKKSVLIRTKHATMSVVPGPGSLQLTGSF